MRPRSISITARREPYLGDFGRCCLPLPFGVEGFDDCAQGHLQSGANAIGLELGNREEGIFLWITSVQDLIAIASQGFSGQSASFFHWRCAHFACPRPLRIASRILTTSWM